MVYRPKIDDKLCFVLMPFGHPYDSYYHKIIKPAATQAGLVALRSDEIRSTNAIVNDIWQHLWRARVIVSDVSNRNPNVNYELGLCDALGLPTIIITGKIEDVPFDYKHKRCILYHREEAGCDEKLREDLVSTMQAVLAETSYEDHLKWPYDTQALKESALGGALLASADSRAIVIRGANLVRHSIASAFGPRGSSVSLPRTFAGAMQVDRGSQIAAGIRSLNPLEQMGMEQIRITASSVYDLAGDCSKLAGILAAGFMTKGQELIEKGFHPRDVVESLKGAIEKVANHLTHGVRPADESGALIGVATTAASGDTRIGALVVEAMKRAGRNGIVTIETSDTASTTLEVVEGTVLDQGWLSEYFVTNPETLECVLENCAILLHQRPISSMKDLLPLLELVAKSDTSLLVVAGDVEGEALSTMIVNKIRGTLRCVAVKAPGHGDRRKAIMEDIAVLTGAKLFSEDIGVPLTNIRLGDLGKADKVIVSKHETTISGGAGASEDLENRVRSVRAQIEIALSATEREKLQERLAKLVGSLAVLKAGGLSEAEVAQERYRLESAMHSARSGLENGWVVGGGIALLRAGASLKLVGTSTELAKEANQAVASVLEEPVTQLVENSRSSPSEVLAEILRSESQDWGFDARSCRVADLVASGILDAAKPVEMALRMAMSQAASVLQTGSWGLDIPSVSHQKPDQQA
jgi:chaperonin GroEL